MVHECLKSSLAFRKPAVAAASRRPVRAGGPKVGGSMAAWPCNVQACRCSLGAGRASWRAGQHQLSAVGSRILLANADAKQKVSAISAEAIGS